MANDADNVVVAVTGGVSYAPIGTALPTNATAPLNGAFGEVGYVSEDGITQSIGTDTSDIRAWQNGDIVRRVQTSHEVTYALTMIESSPLVLEAYYGNYAAGTVEIRGDQPGHKEWVINVLDGGAKIRIVIPDGQVTERGDVQYVNSDAVSYPVTITAYPDANGVKAYLYFDGVGELENPVLASAAPATSAAAGGELVLIRGTGFMDNGVAAVTGPAGVTFGGDNAPQYEVISDTLIAAVAPANPVGAAPIVITNTAGPSAPLAFTMV